MRRQSADAPEALPLPCCVERAVRVEAETTVEETSGEEDEVLVVVRRWIAVEAVLRRGCDAVVERLERPLVGGRSRERHQRGVEPDGRVSAGATREHVDALGKLCRFAELAEQSAHRARQLSGR